MMIASQCNGTRTITCGNPQKNHAMAYARESPDKEKCTANKYRS